MTRSQICCFAWDQSPGLWLCNQVIGKVSVQSSVSLLKVRVSLNKHCTAEKHVVLVFIHQANPKTSLWTLQLWCQCPANKNRIDCQQQNSLAPISAATNSAQTVLDSMFLERDIKTEHEALPRQPVAHCQAAGKPRWMILADLLCCEWFCYDTSQTHKKLSLV